MAETPDTTETVEQSPDMSHTPDAPPPTPSPTPFWRRLVRRDAGFGVLVLLALLVTVLVISRLPSASTPPTTRQTSGTATPATQSAQSGAIVQHANAQIIPMPTSRAGLMQPAVDAQGNIWVGEMVTNQLARIDPKTGQVTEWVPPGGKYNIMATAIDRQGDIWFTEQAANYIGRFDPATETFKTFPLDTAIAPRMAPQDLAFDANGQLWFTLLGGRIGRLDPATGAIQSWQIPVPPGATRSYPFSLAITSSGVWFGYLTGGAVGKLDPTTGKVTQMPLANHQAAVYAMAADPSGRIWFTEMQPAILGSIDPATGKVTELAVPHAAGDPSILYGMVTTGDGSVWFASAGANAVVHYQASDDLFNFYTLPATQSIPFGMALGHNGALWISGDGAADNFVARLTA